MTDEEVGKLLRKLDRQMLSRGFHDSADSALFYVGRAGSKSLYTQRADIPSLDHHPDLSATELLHYIAEQATARNMLPIRNPNIVGVAWSMEAFQGSVERDAPLHVMDQFRAAHNAREMHKWPGAEEVRSLSVVMTDGAEGGLVRRKRGDVWLSFDQQSGLVARALRILCGLPEDDPEEPAVFAQ